ncbi:MFS transporter [Corynebacterium cystitidis]|uniref:MFS transporter n=1 Tax=Corynebacterium cystitidis TaxID=35757 RepID=UPI00211DF880|nr:MFS transporter [Corynebacterium cystitidis]
MQTKRNSRWYALSALSLGYFLVMADQAIVPVLTPHLPAGVEDSVWITSVYLLFTVVPMLVTGRLGDRVGQRRMYLIGLAIYLAGLALASVAASISVLVSARAIQGLGAAAFLPQAFGVINRVFPADARGPAYAVWGVVGSLGSLIGPVFAGAVVEGAGWRATFAAQVLCGLVALGLAVVWAPRLSTTTARIDAPSVIVSLVGLGGVIYGIQYGWWPAGIVGTLALLIFMWLQRGGGDEALLPLSLFANRNFTLGSLGIAAMGFAVAAQFIPIMYWLQDGRGVDAVTAGLLTVPMSVVALILTPFVGVAADRVSPKILSAIGFATMTASMLWAWWVMASGAAVWWMMGITALKGVGSAFIWAPNAATTMRTIPEQMAGAASGAYNTVRQVGSVVGVATIGGAMGAWLPQFGVEHAAAGTMLILAAVMCAGLVASFFLWSDIRPRKR